MRLHIDGGESSQHPESKNAFRRTGNTRNKPQIPQIIPHDIARVARLLKMAGRRDATRERGKWRRMRVGSSVDFSTVAARAARAAFPLVASLDATADWPALGDF